MTRKTIEVRALIRDDNYFVDYVTRDLNLYIPAGWGGQGRYVSYPHTRLGIDLTKLLYNNLKSTLHITVTKII
jgi:hypothetical protein